MSRIPLISGIRFLRTMEQIGYRWDHTEGSHMILVHPERKRLSVPNHRELGRGLTRKLISDAGLDREEFIELLNR